MVDVVGGTRDDDLIGEIRVAYSSAAAAVDRFDSPLFLFPYGVDGVPAKRWRLAFDGRQTPRPSALQVAQIWLSAFRRGDADWLSQVTAMPFAFRTVNVNPQPAQGDDRTTESCAHTVALPYGMSVWRHCLDASEDDDSSLALRSVKWAAQPGIERAAPRLRAEARGRKIQGTWASAVGESAGIRYDLLLSLRTDGSSPLVSNAWMAVTMSSESLRERKRRLDQQAFASAIQRGDVNAIRDLLRAGADVNEVGNDVAPSDPPLSLAIDKGRTEIVDVLLKGGANPNWCCCECVSPLHRAVLRQRPSLVARLLEFKADPTISYQGRMPILDLARQLGNGEIIRLIEGRLQGRPGSSR